MSEKNPFGCYDRRFLKELAPALVGMVLAVALKFSLPETFPRWPLKALMSVIFAYTILVTVAAIRRLDELEQRIHLQAIAISFAVTGMLVTTADFLAGEGFPRIGGLATWAIMVMLWYGGAYILRRRYR